MPRFIKYADNMNNEVCDYYDPVNAKENRLCKHFHGTTKEVDRCRHYCSILESKRLMEEDTCIRT